MNGRTGAEQPGEAACPEIEDGDASVAITDEHAVAISIWKNNGDLCAGRRRLPEQSSAGLEVPRCNFTLARTGHENRFIGGDRRGSQQGVRAEPPEHLASFRIPAD